MAKAMPAPDDEPSLAQLGREVSRLAAQFAVLAEQDAVRRARSMHDEAPVDAGYVRSLIRGRARRSLWFAPEFRHPGWSLMLELFARRLEGRPARISDLTPATGVPATTVLRWIDVLVAEGLVVRRALEGAGRGVLVELTEHGARRMHGYLSAAPPPAGPD